jgi:hypothetical protein
LADVGDRMDGGGSIGGGRDASVLDMSTKTTSVPQFGVTDKMVESDTMEMGTVWRCVYNGEEI